MNASESLSNAFLFNQTISNITDAESSTFKLMLYYSSYSVTMLYLFVATFMGTVAGFCYDASKAAMRQWIRTEAITRHLFTTFPALIAGNIVLIAVNVVVDIFHICMLNTRFFIDKYMIFFSIFRFIAYCMLIVILPSILLFGGGLIFGLLIAFAIVMFKQNQILKKATAPPSPPNKNNSLTKRESVEVTIEDEVQKKTTQTLNTPVKLSEKRRRAKASTKAINVHMRKRTDENPYSGSKTKSTGSSSNSIGEESFERRLSNGPKDMPKPGTLQNSATPISKRKHVRTGMHETPEKLVKALKDCSGPDKEGIFHAVMGRCDVADKNKLEMIEEGLVPAIIEFLNPNYSTHTRKTAVEYLFGLRKFGTAHGKIIQELSAPSSLAIFASYLKSLTHEETSTFPQIARLYLTCLYKQKKEGTTQHIEIHDFMVNAATTWMTRADIHEENNVKTITAAVDIASEILNESQPKLFSSNAEGKLATVDLFSIAIHRLTFSLKLYTKTNNEQLGSSKWAFLNSWSGDFADGESAHRNELMDLLKRLWQCARILARDEKIHGLLLDPNRHLIDNMRMAVEHFQSGAIYVETPQAGSLCERFIDALCEFSKSGEGLKAVETMKDVLLVPLTACASKQGETCSNKANEIMKKLGTPAKTPSKIQMKTPEKLPVNTPMKTPTKTPKKQ